MKHKIIGTVIGLLVLPAIYLIAQLASKLDVRIGIMFGILVLGYAGYCAGKLYNDTE